jgi:hypothetical protein
MHNTRYIGFMIVALFFMVTSYANATPKQVVIVRHGDKLLEDPGQTLSQTGYLRAVALSQYYVKYFNSVPDIVFAVNPSPAYDKFREIQTVAPIVNVAAGLGKKLKISHPYSVGQEAILTEEILSDKSYDGKNILICWEHLHIGKLLNGFGIPGSIIWEDNDFDTVYLVTFTKDKHAIHANAERLDNQYPIQEVPSWDSYLISMQK